MSESAAKRPPQVTFGGWVILLGSVFVLISVYETVAGLRTIDTRDGVLDALDEPPLDGMGLDLQEVLGFMHGTAMLVGACAAAMAILGGYVLKRNKAARIVVTVLAVPLFLAGMVVGGFASSMVAVATILLWTRPARDWFDGREPAPTARERESARVGAGASADPWRVPPSSTTPSPSVSPHAWTPQAPSDPASEQDGPREVAGFGTVPSTPSLAPGRRVDGETMRPRELAVACGIAWLLSTIVLLSMLIAVFAFATSDQMVRDLYESDASFEDLGISVSALRNTAIVTSAVLALWSAFALVLAGFTWAGHEWARWTLFVSAVVAALFSLMAAVSAPFTLLATGATVYAAVLLTRPAITRWIAAKKSRRNR